MMDKDKNGHLSFEELRDGLSMIGHTLPDPDVQMLLDAVSSSKELPLFILEPNFNKINLFVNY